MMTLLICAAMAGAQAGPPEQAVDLSGMEARGTKVTKAADGSLAVEFLPGDWPNVNFRAGDAWDWSAHGGLALDIRNPGKEPVPFGLRVDDDPTADGVRHCRQAQGAVPPGQTVRFVLPIGLDPMDVGMRGLPAESTGLTVLSGTGKIDRKHIVAFQVFLNHPSSAKTLVLSRIRLVPHSVNLDGIVDAFGQYARGDWPGKVKSEGELKARLAQEETELKRVPVLRGFDRFGGWLDGPELRPTGFFRAEQVNGKWWLVNPDGRLFFSLGMDCVGNQGETFVQGREKMFSWLPGPGDPLQRFFGTVQGAHSGPLKEGRTFNFLSANLFRRYGENFHKAWLDHSLKRLRSWGFNTVGNWSDSSLYGNGRVPYVATAHIGGNHARVASGQDYWGTMHDPFDPQFAADVRASLEMVARSVPKDDPWCVGWFVDNEISWGSGSDDRGRYGLALGTLALDSAASPAKRAFIERLRALYQDFGSLRTAWGIDAPGWQTLEAPYRHPGAITEAMRKDLSDFVKEFARTYFRVVREEQKRVAPNHLYLGCRFAWYTPEAVQAGAEFCDVVSFSIYRPRLDSSQRAFFAALNKPCIIGEFHFGALDRGMFHTGLVAAANQKERAAMYVDYVRSVVDDPSFVGCHWFQFHDEPLTGRWFDGENYNIGFITVTDTPYPEMVAAARQVHAEAYSRRGAGSSPSSAGR